MNDNNNAIFSHTLLSLSLASMIAGSLYAEIATANYVAPAGNVNTIQIKQAKSIEAGARIGKLTPKEARKLREEQKEITTIEQKMRKDGALNALELSKLFERLQYAQKNINELLRNNISSHAHLSE